MKKFFSMLAAIAMIAGASADAGSIIITNAGAMSGLGGTGITIGDKLFNNFTFSGFDASDRVTLEENGMVYSLTVGELGDDTVGAITFDYDITVTDPNNAITTAALDSTVDPFFSTLVIKEFNNGVTLVSSTGSTDVQAFTPVTTLHVHVTTSGVANSDITSILDTYIQAPQAVPEPSTVALLSLGGLGLLIRSARRRRTLA